jgi:hypothetical protein
VPTGYDDPIPYDSPIGYNGETTDVRAALYDPAYGTPIAALTRTKDRQWLDELNKVGTGQFTIGITDDDTAQLDYDMIIRFAIGGQTRFAARIEEMPAATRARGEDVDWTLTVSGRGILAVLEDAKLLPEQGVGKRSPVYRLFNFSSKYYNDSDWDAATVRKVVSDAGDPYPAAPEAWPDATEGVWIAPQADSGTPPQPIGKWYARQVYTVTEQGDYRLFVSADDGYRAFHDAYEVGGEVRAYLWAETKYHDLGVLDPGQHIVSFEVENIVRDAPLDTVNISSLVYAVAKMEDGGKTVGEIVARSDMNTKVLPYPGDEPGMTPGDVILLPIQEEQIRGGLAGVSWDFDVILDSDDQPWPLINVGFPVGATSLLDIVNALAETSIDVSMGPDSLTLHAWNKPHGTDLSGTVELVAGGNPDANLGELLHDSRGPTMTVGLARLPDGLWYEREDSGAVLNWGRRVQYLELGTAQDLNQADRVIDAAISVRGAPSTHYKAVVEVTGTPAVPYEDMQLGDTITVPDDRGFPTTERVEAIGVSEDNNAQPIYRVEL